MDSFIQTQRYQLLNYAFRSVFPQKDGGIIIVAEQYYFYEQATTDARGMSQMVSHYQYNDLLLYKIDSVGNFSWKDSHTHWK